MEKLMDVARMVSELGSVHAVTNHNFYVICFNTLCTVNEVYSIPNEVGIVKYSIQYGIEDTYHSFIDPGPVPLGYMGLSKFNSENTHAIPISGFKLANKDYRSIYNSILKMLNPLYGPAILFCSEESLGENEACLRWICSQSKNTKVFPFRLYDVTSLLQELRKFVNRAFSSRNEIKEFLNNSAYDYVSQTRCDFHEDLDSRYCALGYAKRLCFLISNAVCSSYGVQCTLKHLPKTTSGQNDLEISQFSFHPFGKDQIKKKTSYKPTKNVVGAASSNLNIISNNDNKNTVPRKRRFRGTQEGFLKSSSTLREWHNEG